MNVLMATTTGIPNLPAFSICFLRLEHPFSTKSRFCKVRFVNSVLETRRGFTEIKMYLYTWKTQSGPIQTRQLVGESSLTAKPELTGERLLVYMYISCKFT